MQNSVVLFLTMPALLTEPKATSENVIPVKTGIYNQMKLLDSRFSGSDRLEVS